jgi:hypothetical protein
LDDRRINDDKNLKTIIMKQLSAPANFLDNTFRKVEEESQIMIEFTCSHSTNGDRFNDDFSIQSVNGHSDHHEYHHYIEKLFNDILNAVIEKNLQMQQSESSLFIESAIKRLKQLKFVIRYERVRNWNAGMPGFWVFAHPGIRCMEDTVLPKYYYNFIISKASRFALVWKKAINRLVKKLEAMETFCLFAKMEPVASKQVIHCQKKIKLNVPVSQLGCFMWGLNASKLLSSDNKNEMYRVVTSFIETKHQPSISEKSFRNNFNYPTPAAIDACIINLLNIVAILKALKEKLTR